MFDANMRYLPKGHKFIGIMWGCEDTSPLYKHYKGMDTLILCTMLDDDEDNPQVEVHFSDGTNLLVRSHDESEFKGLWMHKVLYFGTVTEEGKLVDFRYQGDYDLAKKFLEEFVQ